MEISPIRFVKFFHVARWDETSKLEMRDRSRGGNRDTIIYNDKGNIFFSLCNLSKEKRMKTLMYHKH